MIISSKTMKADYYGKVITRKYAMRLLRTGKAEHKSFCHKSGKLHAPWSPAQDYSDPRNIEHLDRYEIWRPDLERADYFVASRADLAAEARYAASPAVIAFFGPQEPRPDYRKLLE